MKRRVLAILAVLSLLVCLTTITLWISQPREWSWQTPTGTQGIFVDDHHVGFVSNWPYRVLLSPSRNTDRPTPNMHLLGPTLLTAMLPLTCLGQRLSERSKRQTFALPSLDKDHNEPPPTSPSP